MVSAPLPLLLLQQLLLLLLHYNVAVFPFEMKCNNWRASNSRMIRHSIQPSSAKGAGRKPTRSSVCSNTFRPAHSPPANAQQPLLFYENCKLMMLSAEPKGEQQQANKTHRLGGCPTK
ncbi:unnamed protein product [Ectocarpus sp. 6 AP-2014]